MNQSQYERILLAGISFGWVHRTGENSAPCKYEWICISLIIYIDGLRTVHTQLHSSMVHVLPFQWTVASALKALPWLAELSASQFPVHFVFLPKQMLTMECRLIYVPSSWAVRSSNSFLLLTIPSSSSRRNLTSWYRATNKSYKHIYRHYETYGLFKSLEIRIVNIKFLKTFPPPPINR